MPFPTRPRLFNFRLLAMLAVFAGLASSCQSSRPSFSFRPIVLRAAGPVAHPMAAQVTVADAAPAAPTAAATPIAVTTPPTMAGKAIPTSAAAMTPRAPAATLLPGPLPVSAATTAAVATSTSPIKLLNNRLQRRILRHRAQAPAEVGLGLTVLGLLAMVVLVVALVGLAISGGGLGWIIAAAVAAGVVLLAYLDPGGH
jgi:hypothetical protein